MLDIDRVSMGWSAWFSPRQTRVIDAKLHDRDLEPGDEEALRKMQESFGHEAEIHKRKLGAELTGVEE